MNNLQDIKTIEKYFDDDLSEQQMEDLEVRMLTEPAFRREFEVFRTLRRGIYYAARESTLKEKIVRLRQWADEDSLDQGSIKQRAAKKVSFDRRSIIMFLLGAAAVALMLLFIPVLTPQPLTPAQHFAKYFEPSENFGLHNARGNDLNNPAQEAYLAYENGDYTLAISLFETNLLQDSSHRLTDLYHLGNSYLATGQWAEAIPFLEEVVQSGRPLAENAKWYLALAYLRANDLAKAKELFQEVAAPLDRAKQARKILKNLD